MAMAMAMAMAMSKFYYITMFINIDIDREDLQGVAHKMMSITKNKPMTLLITTRNGIGVLKVEPLPSLRFIELPKVL